MESNYTNKESSLAQKALAPGTMNTPNLIEISLNKINQDDDQSCMEQKKSKRLYDIIIFGASSSVGKFLVEEMALVVDKYYSHSKNNATRPISPSPSDLISHEFLNPIRASKSSDRRKSVPCQVDGIRWAIAGRSAMRLNETLGRAELSTGISDLRDDIAIVLADLNHHKSLLDMCHKTSIIVNCAGPYSSSGEYLIKACIETKTSYIDLAHESNFIEQIRCNYYERARKAGVFIINGCGFQSMSAEMGLNFIKQVVDGQVDEVKILLNLNDTKAIVKSTTNNQAYHSGILTEGMWRSYLIEQFDKLKNTGKNLTVASASSSLSNVKAYGECRSSVKLINDNSKSIEHLNECSQHVSNRILQRKDTQSLVRDVVEFRNRNSFAWLQLFKGFGEAANGYYLPMNNLSNDDSQLIRSEMVNYELRKPDLDSNEGWRPIRCNSYLSMRNLSETVLLLLWLVVFNFLVKFSPARSLMKTFPNIFTLGNVYKIDSTNSNNFNRDSLNHIKFCQTFLTYGTPGDDSGDPLEKRHRHQKRKRQQILISRIVGPEPNHIATATYAVQAALMLALEADHLPSGGGVLTPGAAFADTNIIYQLRRRNIKFEVMKKA